MRDAFAGHVRHLFDVAVGLRVDLQSIAELAFIAAHDGEGHRTGKIDGKGWGPVEKPAICNRPAIESAKFSYGKCWFLKEKPTILGGVKRGFHL